jgi:hypothetical protein
MAPGGNLLRSAPCRQPVWNPIFSLPKCVTSLESFPESWGDVFPGSVSALWRCQRASPAIRQRRPSFMVRLEGAGGRECSLKSRDNSLDRAPSVRQTKLKESRPFNRAAIGRPVGPTLGLPPVWQSGAVTTSLNVLSRYRCAYQSGLARRRRSRLFQKWHAFRVPVVCGVQSGKVAFAPPSGCCRFAGFASMLFFGLPVCLQEQTLRKPQSRTGALLLL